MLIFILFSWLVGIGVGKKGARIEAKWSPIGPHFEGTDWCSKARKSLGKQAFEVRNVAILRRLYSGEKKVCVYWAGWGQGRPGQAGPGAPKAGFFFLSPILFSFPVSFFPGEKGFILYPLVIYDSLRSCKCHTILA